jgi:hypothetical protein
MDHLRSIGIATLAGLVAFVIGFELGMNIYLLEPAGLLVPSEYFAGAFPGLRAGLRAGLRRISPVASSFEAA